MDLEMRNILHAYKLPDTEVKNELEESSENSTAESRKSLSTAECLVKSINSAQSESSATVSNPELLQNESEVEIKQEEISVKLPNKRKKTPEKLIIKKLRENAPYEIDSDSEMEDNYISIDMQKNINCPTSNENKQEKKLQTMHQNTENIKNSTKNADEDKIYVKKVDDRSTGNDAESVDDTSVTTEVSTHSVLVPDEDARDSDPLGTYGLKLEFLESLDITPPIERWVYVTNFRCDKFELRDVMELAGHVLTCSIMNIKNKYARVQYSHPLEAVQAVSMLNGQMFYGLPLKVHIEKVTRNDIILPKGLLNIGLGLGLQGRPVRDIVSQYRNFSKRQNSSINPILFNKINYDYRNYNDDEEKTNDSQMDVENYVASSKTSTFASDRSFKIKHVEDLESNDSGKEKSKINLSPESHSEISLDSPVSNNGIKDDKSNDFRMLTTSTSQSEVPSNTALPLSLSRGHTRMAYPRGILPQNGPFRPQMSPAVPYVPCPSIPPIPDPNVPYTGPFKPGSFCNAVPKHVPNTTNQPQSGSGPLPLNYMPMANQGPSGSGPIHRPGPAPMAGSGPVSRQGSFSGPGAIMHGAGSGPIIRSGAVTGQAMGLVQGSFPGPGSVRGSISGPIGTVPIHGAQISPMRPGPVSRPAIPASGNVVPMTKKSTVQFTNLPPSTTFHCLCEKLSQCGQVLSMQFTTPGCAIVTFSHPAHAERCYHTYNGMTVEGCRITVTIV